MSGNDPKAPSKRGAPTLSFPPRKKGGKFRHAAPLLVSGQLDGRTRARRLYDEIFAGIASDLGGEDHLSVVERELISAFSGAALHLHNLNARLMLGEGIDLSEHAQAVSSLVRVASRIGVRRRPRDLTPTLQEYLAAGADDEAEVVT